MIQYISKSRKNTVLLATVLATTIGGCSETRKTLNYAPSGDIPVCTTNQDFINGIANKCVPVSSVKTTPNASCSCQKSPAIIVDKFYHNTTCTGDAYCTLTITHATSPFILSAGTITTAGACEPIDDNGYVSVSIESC